MPDSESPTSFFRIPRGSSDEEIDSDLASIPDDESVPAQDGSLRGSDEQLAVENPPVADPKRLPASILSSRGRISLANSILNAGRNLENESDAIPTSNSDNESDGVDDANRSAALANITSSVVRKACDYTARKVDPVSYANSKTFGSAKAADGTHPEMMNRIMNALGNANSAALTQDARTNDLKTVAKKLAKVHQDDAELDVPQERPTTEKIERQTTYRLARRDMTANWSRTVERNRQLDHLSFPLVSHGTASKSTGEVAAAARKKDHFNEYEGEIHDMLREAGVAAGFKKDLSQEPSDGAEKLAERVESRKDIQKRRSELAKVRADVLKYEQKMKRIKKIKSKEFRKVLRKEKRKLDALDAEFQDAMAEALRAEQKRVEERVTLRHKNTSKWIKRKLQRGEGKKSSDTREAIEEQLRLHERLKVKQGYEPSAADDDSDLSDQDGDDSTELRNIESELLQDEVEPRSSKKGLMSLAFMKAAEARERQKVKALLQASDGTSGEATVQPEVVGRMAFRGGTSEIPDKQEASTQTENATGITHTQDERHFGTAGDLDNHHDAPREQNLRETLKKAKESTDEFTSVLHGRLNSKESNPWLQVLEATDDPVVKTGHSNASPVSARKELKHSNQARKAPQKRSAPSNELTLSSAQDSRRKKKKARKGGNISNPETSKLVSPPQASLESKLQDDPSSNAMLRRSSNVDAYARTDEDKGPADMLGTSKPSQDVERMEEVAALFSGAGGADLAEFQEAKEAEIESELPTAKSVQAEVLPGWGQWDGAGMSKKAKQRRGESSFARAARERLEKSRSTAIKARSDRKLQNVVLQQRRSQRAAQLTLGAVPFPFVSREQWQKEVSNPVSSELLSSSAFKDNVQRRVNVKVGSVIEPMSSETRWKPTGGTDAALDQGTRGNGKRALLAKRKDRVESRDRARRGLLS